MRQPKSTAPKLTPRTSLKHWRRAWRFVQWRQRPGVVPWGSFLLVFLLTLVLPTVLDIGIGARYPALLQALHYIVSTGFAVTSLMIVLEVCAAWREAEPPLAIATPLPRCTAIVAAYLPNEKDIIGDTLTHLLTTLDVPHDALEVLLAYNTPEALEVEDNLQALALQDPRLRLLRVEGSRSKAENVNAAVRLAEGEVVAVFDADHRPEPACFRKAWRWLGSGWDMVQGRCVIRNGSENWLTRTVAVEFDAIYGISHQGRSSLSRAAIFGGSNGYWRREVLQSAPMDPAMLTEDIDTTVRALLQGRRLAHDRSIVSEELAPTRLRYWLFQRKRWSQGWLEVTLHHQKHILSSPYLTLRQKALWTYLLAWGACFPFLSVQIVPLLLSAWALGRSIPWFGNAYFLDTSILTLASGPFLLLAAYLRTGPRGGFPRLAWFLVYSLLGLFYTSLKTLVTLVAQCSHFLRDRQWVTTPRQG